MDILPSKIEVTSPKLLVFDNWGRSAPGKVLNRQLKNQFMAKHINIANILQAMDCLSIHNVIAVHE